MNNKEMIKCNSHTTFTSLDSNCSILRRVEKSKEESENVIKYV
jgi:hypothetical protein